MSENPSATGPPDELIIAPQGRLDMIAAPALREQLRSEVARGHTRLVLDLAGVDHIDSAGLSALISGLKAARQAGGTLVIARPSKPVRAMLKLTNLHRVLESRDQADKAIP